MHHLFHFRRDICHAFYLTTHCARACKCPCSKMSIIHFINIENVMLTSVFIFFSQLTNIVCQTKHMHASMYFYQIFHSGWHFQLNMWSYGNLEKSDDRGGQRVCVNDKAWHSLLLCPVSLAIGYPIDEQAVLALYIEIPT